MGGYSLRIYLTMHDRQAGHNALQAILIAAGCFGFFVLTFSTSWTCICALHGRLMI
jgi:hypothetical protein